LILEAVEDVGRDDDDDDDDDSSDDDVDDAVKRQMDDTTNAVKAIGDGETGRAYGGDRIRLACRVLMIDARVAVLVIIADGCPS
jgi:hypothetical protein